MRTTRLIRCSLLLGLLLPVVASAVELYRYTDERGTTVLSRQGVPPEHIGRGYQVLNEQGRVIRVIPPAPTAEELRRMQLEKARALSDVQLLRLYSTPEDVERARQRKLAELRMEHRDLDAAIDALTGSGSTDQLQIARLKKRKLRLKDQIAVVEDQLLPDIIA